MNILVLNCGSSSVKYQLIESDSGKSLAKGSVDRIGMSGATLTNLRHDGDEIKIAGEIVDHTIAIEYILAVLLSRNHGVISDKSDIHAIGHRVVHGGETFSGSVLITDEVIKTLRENIELAPLHNPHNLRGIAACEANLPGTRRWGCSTPPSTRRCPSGPTSTASPIRSTRSTRSAVTASTARRTGSWRSAPRI